MHMDDELLVIRVDFDMYTHIISHGEQNLTLAFKVKGQGYSGIGYV